MGVSLAKVPDKKTWSKKQGHVAAYLRPPLTEHIYYSEEGTI